MEWAQRGKNSPPPARWSQSSRPRRGTQSRRGNSAPHHGTNPFGGRLGHTTTQPMTNRMRGLLVKQNREVRRPVLESTLTRTLVARIEAGRRPIQLQTNTASSTRGYHVLTEPSLHTRQASLGKRSVPQLNPGGKPWQGRVPPSGSRLF